tara:strand:- start:642 stop:2078 length:1437 start_codon:yes stop_codon:yes gene_type:complete
MKQEKYFYERSNLLESEVNINFEELLWMDDSETTKWIDKMRNFILSEWDDKGIPPTIGQSEIQIRNNFKKLRDYNVQQFLIFDDSDNKNVIKNYNKFASGVNQFFPTMLKTRVGKSSIYDWFTDEYKDKFHKVIRRILKRDSMYNWSKCVLNGEELPEHFFVVQHKKNSIENIYKTLTIEEIEKLDDKYKTNLPTELDDENYKFLIHRFELGQKLFPAGIQAFRLGLGQPAVNFPPLTARWIYENYTKHISKEETLNIYDPSSGWGGRILGAMSSHRKIHYIGTDPNTDNFIDELGITRYEYVADFFNNKCLETNSFWEEDKNTYHIFQEGSEHIGNHKDFQQYKGKLDLIFTSPPYFDREQYSDDAEQSFKAYPQYEDWRDNFLKPTLENCYHSLKDDRYILWNIADIKIGKDKYYPLEQDSIDILTNLGMEYKGKLKMLMTSMVGVNQENVKNSVIIEKKALKYEPIFVFYKRENK